MNIIIYYKIYPVNNRIFEVWLYYSIIGLAGCNRKIRRHICIFTNSRKIAAFYGKCFYYQCLSFDYINSQEAVSFLFYSRQMPAAAYIAFIRTLFMIVFMNFSSAYITFHTINI